MINLELTVREALWILSKCEVYDSVYDKIVIAFEKVMDKDKGCNVTITGGMNTNNRISCIKHIRSHTRWGLKESKEWTDVLVGRYDEYGRLVPPGNECNTVTLKDRATAENLLRELTMLGCDGFLS